MLLRKGELWQQSKLRCVGSNVLVNLFQIFQMQPTIQADGLFLPVGSLFKKAHPPRRFGRNRLRASTSIVKL